MIVRFIHDEVKSIHTFVKEFIHVKGGIPHYHAYVVVKFIYTLFS